jgi:MFS transporter, OFA family, oxalate/formate antiporter
MSNEKFASLDKKRKVYFIACLIGALIVGLAYTWSVLQNPFVQQLGGEAVTATVVLCYTVTVVSSTMSPSVFGSFTRKLGPKKTIFIGTLLFGLGYIVSGYTTSMVLFFISFGLGTGIGSGLIYPTIMGYLATLFPDKRGTVSGVVAGVYGGASILWSPMLAAIIEKSSLGTATLVAGLMILVIIIPVSLMIQPVPEDYIEYKLSTVTATGKKAAKKTNLPDLTRGQMVKTSMFYVALIAFAFGCTSGMMVISQVSSIMQKSFALSATEAALYVSVMSLMSMCGRFLWGTVTDHFDKYVTLSIICGLPIIAMGVASVAGGSMVVTVICLAVTALCYGGFGSTITPITADLFGAKHVTENYGVMYLAFGFAGLIGPQLAVNLSDGGNYSTAFLVAAIISVIALVMALIVRKKVASATVK